MCAAFRLKHTLPELADRLMAVLGFIRIYQIIRFQKYLVIQALHICICMMMCHPDR